MGNRSCSAANREKAEPCCVVHPREDKLFILEAEQTDERLPLNHILEEELGGVVGGNAGGQHAANATPVVEQIAHALGKDGVDVDVAPTAERITTAVAHEVALALSLPRVIEELLR